MNIMKKTIGLATVFTGLLSAASVITAGASSKVIYGADDRLDHYQASSTRKQLADSTVALFRSAKVAADGKLTLINFGLKENLCLEEPFREQPSGAFCSGSLIGPDLILTAGHCVTGSYDCADTKFLFGYAVTSEGYYPGQVDPSEVYSCKQVVSRMQEDEGADYAVIKLDREVKNHTPLKVSGKDASVGTRLFVIGHPSGLPVKVAGGASVRSADGVGFFVANLDTYGGNSGSAVFNEETGLIEGVLVRGDNDYVEKGNCMVSQLNADNGGRGEDVTKASAFSEFIPKEAGEVSQEARPVTVQSTGLNTTPCTNPGPDAPMSLQLAYANCLAQHFPSFQFP